MATMKFIYPQDPETVFKFLSDPETSRRRSEAFGEEEIRVSASGSTVTNVRKVVAEVPSFAKKFLNPKNVVTDIKAWNAGSKTATLTVDIGGAPLKMSGNIRIVPSGSGSEYIVDFTMKCSVPLVGGQIEKHATGVSEEGMRREYEWNKAELAKL